MCEFKKKKAKTDYKKEKVPMYLCKTCNSDRVEGKFYVNLNTKEPDMNDWGLNSESDYYCIDCKAHTEIVEAEIEL